VLASYEVSVKIPVGPTLAWWCNSRSSVRVGLTTARLLDRLSPGALPDNNFGQVIHTHVPVH